MKKFNLNLRQINFEQNELKIAIKKKKYFICHFWIDSSYSIDPGLSMPYMQWIKKKFSSKGKIFVNRWWIYMNFNGIRSVHKYY